MRRIAKDAALPLLTALIHGLLYLFIVPPWQHYDEPGHMEYVWHIAHKERLPLPDDVDRNMRFDFAESMARHRFFGDAGNDILFDRSNGPTPEIGFVQLEDSPIYYLGPALFVLPVRDEPIEVQLYAARAFSLLLLLLTVTCAWGVARELAPNGHPVRWMLPFSVAMLPPLVDLMTAVNSDAGAIAAYSLFLWGATRLIQRNTPTRRAIDAAFDASWVLASAVLCLAVKPSAASAVVVAVPVLIFGLVPQQAARTGLIAVFALLLGAALLTVRTGDALAWYRTEASASAPLTQCTAPECMRPPHGTHAIRVASDSSTPGRLLQSLPPDHTAQLRGRVVTIAGWMWTNAGESSAALPWLSVNYQPYTPPSTIVNTAPVFFAYTRTIPANAHYTRLTLTSPPGTTVFHDGLMVIVGEPSMNQTPSFADERGDIVRWGNTEYVNLIRNSSGEDATIGLRPSTLAVLDAVTPSWMIWQLGVSSLLDLRGSGWYYLLVARHIFESFWGRFAWGQVALPEWMFVCIAAVVIAGALGLLLPKRGVRLGLSPMRAITFTIVALLCFVCVGIPSSMRGIATIEVSLWLPGARYWFPTVIIMLLPLSLGLAAFLENLVRGRGARLYVALWLLLGVCGLGSVILQLSGL